MNRPIYDLLDDRPGLLLIAVRDPEDRHIIGTIQQTAAHKFRAHGSYFDVVLSDLEYAKSVFVQSERPQPTKTVDNQLTLL